MRSARLLAVAVLALALALPSAQNVHAGQWIIYDDNVWTPPTDHGVGGNAGTYVVERFSPPSSPARLVAVEVWLMYQEPGQSPPLELYVWDSGFSELAGPITVTFPGPFSDFFTIPLGTSVVVSGDFYVGLQWTQSVVPNSAVGVDTDGPPYHRSYLMIIPPNLIPINPADNNLMIRAEIDPIAAPVDVYWLAKTITNEAGYCGQLPCTPQEQIAVGWTVLNRLSYPKEFGTSIQEVVEKGYVPSWKIIREPTESAIVMAQNILGGKIQDPTSGATHFFSPNSMPKLYTWWKIRYDDGVEGWSAENWLELVSTSQEPQPVGGKFKKGDRVKTTAADLGVRKDPVFNDDLKVNIIGESIAKMPGGSEGVILDDKSVDASTPIDNLDVRGGLHLVPIDRDEDTQPADRYNKVWLPCWAKPAEGVTITQDTTTYLAACYHDKSTGKCLVQPDMTKWREWTNLPNIRNWYFMFYRPYIKQIDAKAESPVELRVYDSDGLVTGLVDGKVMIEIPGSYYYDNTVAIFFPSDSYRYEVAGTTEGSYGLTVTAVTRQESIVFAAITIPTSADAIHQYTIDWYALSQGEKGVTLQIDSDSNGIFEQIVTADSELTSDEFMLETATSVDFDPDTLNLKSKGKTVTVYIELPQGYDIGQIDVSSIRLNGTITALTRPTEIGDYDRDGIPDLMVKLDRAAVIALFKGKTIPGTYVIEVTGTVMGICFKGTDTTRVMS